MGVVHLGWIASHHSNVTLGKARWKTIRRIVRNRDGNQCLGCGITAVEARLYVHHVQPQRLGGTDTLDNLILVCQRCHMRLERETRAPRRTRSRDW